MVGLAALPRAAAFDRVKACDGDWREPAGGAGAMGLPRANSFVEASELAALERYDSVCRRFAEDMEKLPYGAASLAERSQELDKKYPPEQVLINVYELVAFDGLNQWTGAFGGALHAGVEVFGREWSYGGGQGPGSGVVCEVPRSNQQHRFRETVVLPRTPKSDGEVALIIGALLEEWHPEDYHWLRRNCLTFANELCELLGAGRLPAWIDRFARGAGAVDFTVKGIMESVHDVATGARELMQTIVQVNGSCGRCSGAERARRPRGGHVDAHDHLSPQRVDPHEHLSPIVRQSSVLEDQDDVVIDADAHGQRILDCEDAQGLPLPRLAAAGVPAALSEGPSPAASASGSQATSPVGSTFGQFGPKVPSPLATQFETRAGYPDVGALDGVASPARAVRSAYSVPSGGIEVPEERWARQTSPGALSDHCPCVASERWQVGDCPGPPPRAEGPRRPPQQARPEH